MKPFSKRKICLGVNIDHVATLRQARMGAEPDPCEAALEAIRGGAGQITVHLREDRRHIQDRDLIALKKKINVPLNLEMALDESIVKIAMRLRPEKVCIVPEKRQELTTEGGLDVIKNKTKLRTIIPRLQSKGIEVSLFIDAKPEQIKTASGLGADAIEIHTGRYAESRGAVRRKELERIQKGARQAAASGLIVNAGHGLTVDNVGPICAIKEIQELNIGHHLVSLAVITGLRKAVRLMRKKIDSFH